MSRSRMGLRQAPRPRVEMADEGLKQALTADQSLTPEKSGRVTWSTVEGEVVGAGRPVRAVLSSV